MRAAYERGETDEFIKPTLVGRRGPHPGRRRGDLLQLPPRPRAAAHAEARARPASALTTLTEYHEDWDHPVAFPPARPDVTLASTLAERGKAQLHVAETEKYAHVTYFFNGGEEDEYPGEERRLVDSPRDVPTYDKKPEMSAREAAAAFAERWRDGDFTLRDHQLREPGHGRPHRRDRGGRQGGRDRGRVPGPRSSRRCSETGGVCVITADHGNADQMLEPDGSPNTAHSKNPVPLIVTADMGELREGGTLSDVAPTILALLGEEQPAEMSGTALLDT